ncbi:MAG: hypothetical protein A2X56_14360 [Nitrospirae bacterium GWC2_57_13]|jgi:HAMP domain-containing protein|nr:MAG: hypothetical protein A2072_01265 [Nitrospirae bacterium GWC1_57_7]OGW27122.1 MAG: hypothetical protein A2X56_14360 [Nitrospirae bacterium GWC2_57_13]OGW45140.1 MAG: hypothetical protein A2X57_02680 [Nitrospirae bacterium GWD2_57_8]HAR44920.1 hypothetical protein [Nitrospiraceae bacterium]HAS52756.1 hypothetical protein [Nitrospiraceae bacterium]
MLKNYRLRAKFFIIAILIFCVSLPIVAATSYYALRKNVEREMFEKAELFLNTIESVRKQIGKVTRPAVMKETPNKFIVEAMSTSFNARGVAERVKEKFPEYTFRHISMNPRYLPNKADAFEEGVIRSFQADRAMTENAGFVSRDGYEYFYVAKPVASEVSCLQCHGAPDMAPKEVVARYGDTAAFGWQANEVVAALIAYVPTRLATESTMRALIVFGSLYSGLFLFLVFVIDMVVARSIVKPISNLAETANNISKGHMDMEFKVDSNDELKVLSDAFERMKTSLNKAMQMLKK